MKTRVISGVVLAILLFLTLFLGGYVTLAVLLFVSLVAYHELVAALGVSGEKGRPSAPELIGYCAVVLHYLFMAFNGGKFVFFILTLMLLFMGEAAVFVFTFPKYTFAQMMSATFSFVYAPMMLSFIYILRIREDGALVAWIPFVAWVCDTSAYFAGSMFGKHKLCPNLSPKKTVEGAVGGCLGSMIVGCIFGVVISNVYGQKESMVTNVIVFAVITLVAGILSQIGDLLASGLKRNHDIKDYGTLIPGHGGIMDRFDSVIFITPAIYFLATFLL